MTVTVVLKMAAFLLSILLWLFCQCAGELETYSEEALKLSSLWLNEDPLVLLKEGDSAIPEFFLQFATSKLAEDGSPAKFVRVECPEGTPLVKDGVCSLLSTHQAVVRLPGEDNRLVGKSFPLEEYQHETEFLVDILESLLGNLLTHIQDPESLTALLSKNVKALVVLTSDKTTESYSSFLISYQLHNHGMPLAVVSTPSSLPLTKRPRKTSNALTLWVTVKNGVIWYPWVSSVTFRSFLIRTKYPDKIAIEENPEILKELRRQGVNFVVVFPPLPSFGSFDFKKFIDRVIAKIYPLFVFITVDRSKSADVASHFYVTDTKKEGHITVVPFGNEENAVGIDLVTKNADDEAYHTVMTLPGILKESHMVKTIQDGDYSEEESVEDGGQRKSSASITEVGMMEIAIQHFQTDMVFVFCKRNTNSCPDDLFFILDKVFKTVLDVLPDTAMHFFVVECDSVKDIQKYKVDTLPSYVMYQRASEAMIPGKGDVFDHVAILNFVANTTGHSKLLDVKEPAPKQPGLGDIDDYLELQQELDDQEHDVYGKIAQTLPFLKLPDSLVLTSSNFEERIREHDKTVVMFYMHWSVKSKVALFHLMEAGSRLEDDKNSALGSVACNGYTDLCTLYNITNYPTVLVFTPSTVSSPTPFPASLGVINSVNLLKALSDEGDLRNTLMELTPVTMPVIMRKGLSIPLILWCDGATPSSELATIFSDVAAADTSKQVAYAWLNSEKYSGVMESVLEFPKGSGYQSVLAFQLSKRTVYQMDKSALKLASDGFKDALLTFVRQVTAGSLQPIKVLPEKDWAPVEPPIPFPSKDSEDEDEDEDEVEDEDEDEEMRERPLQESKPRNDKRNAAKPPVQLSKDEDPSIPYAEPLRAEHDFDTSLPDSELDKIIDNDTPGEDEEPYHHYRLEDEL